MPDYSAWFGAQEIASILKGLQVWPASGDLSPDGSDLADLFLEQCTIAADAVKAEFENRTGWKPFLIERAVVAHSSTTPGGLLQLAIPARTIYSVTIGGTAVDAATYWTQPATSALTGKPIEFIQFSQNYFGGRIYNTPNKITIDADYGYTDLIPADVWRAGTNMAALHTIASIQGEQDIGSISEDSFSISQDLVGPIDDKVRKDFWPAQWERIIRSYTRQTC